MYFINLSENGLVLSDLPDLDSTKPGRISCSSLSAEYISKHNLVALWM